MPKTRLWHCVQNVDSATSFSLSPSLFSPYTNLFYVWFHFLILADYARGGSIAASLLPSFEPQPFMLCLLPCFTSDRLHLDNPHRQGTPEGSTPHSRLLPRWVTLHRISRPFLSLKQNFRGRSEHSWLGLGQLDKHVQSDKAPPLVCLLEASEHGCHCQKGWDQTSALHSLVCGRLEEN